MSPISLIEASRRNEGIESPKAANERVVPVAMKLDGQINGAAAANSRKALFASPRALRVGTQSLPKFIAAQSGFRRIPLSHGRHHGGHVVTWPGSPSLRVESAEEARVVRALVARPECRDITSQPLTVWYEWRGRVRRYTPDLAVTFAAVPSDLRVLGARAYCLVEVKPPEHRWRTPADWEARRHIIRVATGHPLILLSSLTAQGGAP